MACDKILALGKCRTRMLCGLPIQRFPGARSRVYSKPAYVRDKSQREPMKATACYFMLLQGKFCCIFQKFRCFKDSIFAQYPQCLYKYTKYIENISSMYDANPLRLWVSALKIMFDHCYIFFIFNVENIYLEKPPFMESFLTGVPL